MNVQYMCATITNNTWRFITHMLCIPYNVHTVGKCITCITQTLIQYMYHTLAWSLRCMYIHVQYTVHNGYSHMLQVIHSAAMGDKTGVIEASKRLEFLTGYESRVSVCVLLSLRCLFY